jgi:hypothetical protein
MMVDIAVVLSHDCASYDWTLVRCGRAENDAPGRTPAYRAELEPGTGRRGSALLAN